MLLEVYIYKSLNKGCYRNIGGNFMLNNKFKVNHFENCSIHVTNYTNGNVKLEVLTEDEKLLVVLTEEVKSILPAGVVVLNSSLLVKKFYDQLFKEKIINFCKPQTLNGKKVFVSILNKFQETNKIAAYA